MRLQVLEEPFKLLLHRVHLLSHVENYLNAREVHTQVARQRKDQLEPLEIRIGVETRVALRTRGFQQTFTFIQSQRLRMNAVLLRYRADRVGFWFSRHSNPISTRGFVALSFEYSRSNSLVSSEITFGRVTCTSTN